MTYESKKHFLVNFFYYGILLALAILAVKFGWEFLTPFVIAFAVAFFLKPVVNAVNVYLKIKRSIAAIICVLGFYAITVAVISLVGFQIALLIRNLFWSLPGWYTNEAAPVIEQILHKIERFAINIDPTVKRMAEEYSVTALEKLGSAISSLSVTALSRTSSFAAKIPSLFIQTLITIIASVFVSVDYYEITYFIAKQLDIKQISILYDAENYAKSAIGNYLKSYSLILFITFMEVGIGLWLMGIKMPFVISRFIAVFDILPMVGTGGIIIPWGIIGLILGNFRVGFGMLALYLFVTVVRNTIEPKIIGQQVGLHPVATLVSMFLGTKLLGIVGLFGFPITLVILKQLNDTGKIKLYK